VEALTLAEKWMGEFGRPRAVDEAIRAALAKARVQSPEVE
jgi:hypothetical protein